MSETRRAILLPSHVKCRRCGRVDLASSEPWGDGCPAATSSNWPLACAMQSFHLSFDAEAAVAVVRAVAAEFGEIEHDSGADPTHSGDHFLSVTFPINSSR